RGGDASAVGLDDAAHLGQPQTGAWHGALSLSHGPEELVEDALTQLLGDAYAAVGDKHLQFAIGLSSLEPDLDLPAEWCVLYGVLDQVAAQLMEGAVVRLGHQRLLREGKR